jgi:hypothetical protein
MVGMRGMRELHARLSCFVSFVFVFGSVEFFLVALPVFVLVLLVFASAVVRLVSDERLSVFRAWRGFCRRLYIRDVYVRSYSSPLSNSLHSTILKDIAFGTRLLSSSPWILLQSISHYF